MLLGVLVSAIIFIAGSSVIGWLIGYVIDSLKVGKAAPVEVKK
jgi:uncharacterized BrkB/YihY/UPF0761 family membrane protein